MLRIYPRLRPREAPGPQYARFSRAGVEARFWLVGGGVFVVRFVILPFVPFNRPKRLYEDEDSLYDYAVGLWAGECGLSPS